MVQSIERFFSLHTHASDLLWRKHGDELEAAALSASPAFAQKQMLRLNFDGNDALIEEVRADVRHCLERYDLFRSTILPCMLTTQSVAETKSNLSLLNQGPETSVVYKKLIAGYSGVPTGKQLRRFRQAHLSLCDAVAPWIQVD